MLIDGQIREEPPALPVACIRLWPFLLPGRAPPSARAASSRDRWPIS